MKTHDLKTWPDSFYAITSGAKTYELRKNDRDFKVGDILILRLWCPDEEKYLDEHAPIVVRVSHMLEGVFGLKDGFCCLGFTRWI